MTSPIVVVLFIITLISIVIGLRQAKNILAEGEVSSGGKRAPMTFLLTLIAFIGFALYNTASIPDFAAVDRVFPVFVASVTLFSALILLAQSMLVSETHVLFADREKNDEAKDNAYALWPTLAWFAQLLLLTCLVGFVLALVIFLFSFMKLRAGLSWLAALVYCTASIAFICFLAWLLNRDFPPGVLQSFVELPWPLG